MHRRVNFADPDFEPSDEDLQELAREAFAGVTERHRAALDQLYAEIRVQQAAVLARLAAGSSSGEG